MMKSLLYCSIALLASAAVASCSPESKAPVAALRYADSLIESHPDSILSYLRSLDISDFREADKVYYGLLLTQATDKNYLPLLSCDSIIDVALDYYDEGDGINRARALLYKGRIQQSMNMPQEAMQSCFAGLKELGNTRLELRLKRMLFEDLGGIYQSQNLDEKGLEMFKQSYRCDSLLNDEGLLKYSIANIGWVNVVLRHEAIAKQYLSSALRIALKKNDSLFVFNMYSKLSLNCENVDSAFAYIRLAQNSQTVKCDSVSLFLSLGDLFLEKNELDSSEYYLKRVFDCGNFKKKTLASYSLSELEKERGNYELAFNYRSFYGEHIDSVVSLNTAPKIERLAYKYESEVKILKEKERTKNIIQITVYSLLLLVFLFLLIIQRIHRRKEVAKLVYEQSIVHLNKRIALQQLNIERSEKDLACLRQAHEQNREEIAQKEQDIRRMLDEKAKFRNWFFMQTPIYKRIEVLSQQDSGNQKRACVLLQSEQLLLRDTLFQIYDEYIQYLQSTYPKLTEDDYIYCCLQLCQLDDQTMAYCFGNTSKQVVAQRRLRLKKKMEVIF